MNTPFPFGYTAGQLKMSRNCLFSYFDVVPALSASQGVPWSHAPIVEIYKLL